MHSRINKPADKRSPLKEWEKLSFGGDRGRKQYEVVSWDTLTSFTTQKELDNFLQTCRTTSRDFEIPVTARIKQLEKTSGLNPKQWIESRAFNTLLLLLGSRESSGAQRRLVRNFLLQAKIPIQYWLQSDTPEHTAVMRAIEELSPLKRLVFKLYNGVNVQRRSGRYLVSEIANVFGKTPEQIETSLEYATKDLLHEMRRGRCKKPAGPQDFTISAFENVVRSRDFGTPEWEVVLQPLYCSFAASGRTLEQFLPARIKDPGLRLRFLRLVKGLPKSTWQKAARVSVTTIYEFEDGGLSRVKASTLATGSDLTVNKYAQRLRKLLNVAEYQGTVSEFLFNVKPALMIEFLGVPSGGDKIKALRLLNGYSIKEAAALAGIEGQTLTRYEADLFAFLSAERIRRPKNRAATVVKNILGIVRPLGYKSSIAQLVFGENVEVFALRLGIISQGERLRLRRTFAGMEHRELCKAASVHYNTLIDFEKTDQLVKLSAENFRTKIDTMKCLSRVSNALEVEGGVTELLWNMKFYEILDRLAERPSESLKLCRLLAGETQEEIEEEIGVSQQVISEMEDDLLDRLLDPFVASIDTNIALHLSRLGLILRHLGFKEGAAHFIWRNNPEELMLEWGFEGEEIFSWLVVDQLEPQEADEVIASMNPQIGRSVSEETRAKLSVAKKGWKRGPLTAEHRQRISESLTGRTLTEEHRRNLSKAMKRQHAIRAHDLGIQKRDIGFSIAPQYNQADELEWIVARSITDALVESEEKDVMFSALDELSPMEGLAVRRAFALDGAEGDFSQSDLEAALEKLREDPKFLQYFDPK